MRSFAIFVSGAAAAAVYPAYEVSSSAPAYAASTPAGYVAYPVSTPAAYPASSPAGYVAYPASSSPAGYNAYPVSSKAAEYPAYPASSKAPEYPSYTTTTVKGLTTVCAEPTTLKVGTKTYTVTKSTTIIDDDCEYTTTVPVKPTPTPVKPSSAPVVKPSSAPVVKPSSAPAPPPVVPVYPSKNGTAPTYPVATGTPTSTKPAPSQFTGAAAQTGAAMLAIVGAVAAFL